MSEPSQETTPQPDPTRVPAQRRIGVVRLRRTGRATLTLSRRLVWLGVWLVVSVTVASALFLTSSRETTIAGHQAVLRPVFATTATIRSGPLLPDLRLPSGAPVGVSIELGKTEVATTDELLQRYALLAAHPDGQIDKVRGLLVQMAWQAALRGAALGFVPVALWALLGPRRRRELVRALGSRRGLAGGVGLVLLSTAVWQPWVRPEPTSTAAGSWQPLAEFLGPSVTLPAGLPAIEIYDDATTSASQRLVESVVDTYDKSKTFYDQAAARAADLPLRQPVEGETVALMVTDRHDNVGMDPVARAIGDAGGATVVLDAGDDTSTGSDWEAFSLDSLDQAFSDLDRYVAVGNHDHGSFVGDYLADKGWRTMDGEVREGFASVAVLGVADPRSSGLGNWRDERGMSFEETRQLLADTACEAENGRVNLMLVHDANLGKEALARGCVDLVVGGHVHVQNGPNRVVADNGVTGYTYTNGTTGGAAFGIALGSKPKRDAQVALITFADGVPVGIQPVTLRTDGKFVVADYVALDDQVPLLD